MDFREAKRNRRLHAWTLVILLISLFLGLNYLVSKIKAGIDLTQDDQFSLSRETIAWLQKIERPTDIIITIRRSNEQPKIIQRLSQDLKILLNAFASAGAAFPIKVHYVNINSLRQNQDLIERYKLNEQNQIIIASQVGEAIRKKVLFQYSEHPMSISKNSMQNYQSKYALARDAVIESNFYTNWQEGARNSLVPTTFNGEEIILQGLLSVSKDSKGPNKVYFTTGHGEKDPSDVSRENGYSKFQSFIESRNLQVKKLSADPNARIPDDAFLVVIASPQVPFREQEVSRLRSYISERKGNLLILIDPVHGLSPESPPTFGLRPLLKDWDLRCHDMLIDDTDTSKYDIFTGDYAIRTFHKDTSNKIVEPINELGLSIYTGNTRPVEKRGVLFKEIHVIELFFSSRKSWAISNWSKRNIPFEYNTLIDKEGPIPVAALAKEKTSKHYRRNLIGGKIAVLGSSKFFVNRILKENAGNRMLLRNIFYWFIEENEILKLKPRNIHVYTVKMNKSQFNKLLYAMISIPTSIGVLGLIVKWLRIDY